jgi:hypothetical protein
LLVVALLREGGKRNGGDGGGSGKETRVQTQSAA